MPCIWAVTEKLVIQDVGTNFVGSERTAPRGRKQEKRGHLETSVQGALQASSLLGSDVAVLDEHFSVSQYFLGEELLTRSHVQDMGSSLFFFRGECLTPPVGQAISVMGDVQVQSTMMRDTDLSDVSNQLPSDRTAVTVTQGRARTRAWYNDVASSQVTSDLQSCFSEPRVDAVNENTGGRYASGQ